MRLLSYLQFFVTLIDEHSGYSMFRSMQRKSQAPDALREIILEIENLFNSSISTLIVLNRKYVKWLRFDGWGE